MASNEQRGAQALRDLEKELKARDRKEKSGPWAIAALSAVVLLVIGGGVFFLAQQNSDSDVSAGAENTAAETTAPSEPAPTEAEPLALTRTTPLADSVTCSYDEEDSGQSGAPVEAPNTENVSTQGVVTVELDTSAGPIGMELDRAVAPCTVNAIEFLAKKDYFNDTVCHRITTNDNLKVLQCGDPAGTGAGGPGFQFANEYPTDELIESLDTSQIPADLPAEEADQYKNMLLQQQAPVRYERGTIAMANAGLDTNGSQFFLNYGDSALPPLYTYFGKIDDSGLETLDKIAEKGTQDGTPDGAPADEVRITSATVK